MSLQQSPKAAHEGSQLHPSAPDRIVRPQRPRHEDDDEDEDEVEEEEGVGE